MARLEGNIHLIAQIVQESIAIKKFGHRQGSEACWFWEKGRRRAKKILCWEPVALAQPMFHLGREGQKKKKQLTSVFQAGLKCFS